MSSVSTSLAHFKNNLTDQEYILRDIQNKIQELELNIECDIGEIMSSMILDKGIICKLVAFHCGKDHCRDLFYSYLMKNVELRPIQPVQEVKKYDCELQLLQLPREDYFYDYSFRLGERKLEHRSGMVIETVDGIPHDVLFVQSEDNIHRKPFHYRRSKLVPPVTLEFDGIGDKLLVVDSMPYEFGKTGGYFEDRVSSVINFTTVCQAGKVVPVLRGSLATASEWSRFDDLVWTRSGTFKYDYISRTVIGEANYYHSIFDWETVKRTRQKVKMMRYIRTEVEGRVKRYDMEYLKCVGLGARNLFYQFFNTWPVESLVWNQGVSFFVIVLVPFEIDAVFLRRLGVFSARVSVSPVIHEMDISSGRVVPGVSVGDGYSQARVMMSQKRMPPPKFGKGED